MQDSKFSLNACARAMYPMRTRALYQSTDKQSKTTAAKPQLGLTLHPRRDSFIHLCSQEIAFTKASNVGAKRLIPPPTPCRLCSGPPQLQAPLLQVDTYHVPGWKQPGYEHSDMPYSSAEINEGARKVPASVLEGDDEGSTAAYHALHLSGASFRAPQRTLADVG